MTENEQRLLVIENIKNAVKDGDYFRKVELFDPVITDEDVKRVIDPFDNLKKKPKSKLLAFFARKIAEAETKKRNELTEVVGIENALSVNGGAIITQNHFNIMDNTVARLLAIECEKKRDFHIVIQETNAFMEGYFGFLMRNCNTLPVSRSASYMAKNLKPAIKALLEKEAFILIYPEQEMWFNYKKPRELREGAYHYAAEFGVPIIPTFVTMENTDEIGSDGFYKQKHTLHVMRPIYPDPKLSVRENRELMKNADAESKRACYEEFYKTKLDSEFIPERDIAGYIKKLS
jgi:1-acyl-sn-glycerol-3-phosphate acyltransferase